ncbi:transporter [bacterium]|nr:transporter [bacterium]
MKSYRNLIFSFMFLLTLIVFVITREGFAEVGPLGFGYAELHEPMSTDRPDFTESTKTIQRGHLQGEFGYRYTRDNKRDFKQEAIPEGLLRIGVTDLLELRLSAQGLKGTDSDFALGDLTIGTKIKLYEACDCNFDLSTIIDVTLATGAKRYSQEKTSSQLSFLWSYHEDTDWALAGQVNLNAAVERREHYFQPSSSIALSYELTDRLGVYTEYYGFYPRGSHAPSTAPEHYVNGGVTYLLHPNLQLDLLVGVGLNGRADDSFIGSGITFRL